MTSLIGLICGLAVVILGSMSDGDPVSSLYSLTALIIVIGGTLSALLTQFGLQGVISAFKGVVWMNKPPKVDLYQFLDQLSEWTALARSQSTLALEPMIETVSDPVLGHGLQMIVDNKNATEVHRDLSALVEQSNEQDRIPGEFWEAAGGYSPTIGVMGAVLGLIHVMMMLNHPELLGAGIATAFVATIYGVGGANLFFLPLGSRLAKIAEEVEHSRHVIVIGMTLLAQQKSGAAIRSELSIYLNERDKPKAEENIAGDPSVAGMEQAA
jgi:chemotaxis protein MotA